MLNKDENKKSGWYISEGIFGAGAPRPIWPFQNTLPFPNKE
tara:strand:- start:279 stop:401 length:123 start_codon:yes stop_codon:yes gene_type:complete